MTNTDGWQAFFDAHAPDYMANVFTRATLAEVDFLAETLGLAPGARVLDVGCGTAGQRGRRPLELHEFEVMVVARRPAR